MTYSNFPRRLNENESLIFLHILKTAGLTFNSILAKLFPWEYIHPFINPSQQFVQPKQGPYPARISQESVRQLHQSFSPINPETEKPYRMILGHWDYGIVERHPNLIPITFLRDPMNQVISIFKHLRRHNDDWNPDYEKLQKMNIIDWASDPDTRTYYANSQARQLAGILYSFPDNQWRDDEIIEKAQIHLQQCAFVGLTERFEESLLNLAYTFTWNPVTAYSLINPASEQTDSETLTPKEHDAVQSLCELDIALYEFGKKLYNERISFMMQRLLSSSADHAGYLEQTIPASNTADHHSYAKRIFNSSIKQQLVENLAQRSKFTDVAAEIAGVGDDYAGNGHGAANFDPAEFAKKLAEFESVYDAKQFAALIAPFQKLYSPENQLSYQQVLKDYPHYSKLLIDHPALYPTVERYGSELQSYTQGPFPLPKKQVMQGAWLGAYKLKHFPLCDVNPQTLLNKRVLDIGCNAGFDTFYFTALGASEVIGIDPSPFVYQAFFLRSLYHCPTLRLAKMRWQEITPVTFGKFDMINCQGILYHERYPYMLLERLFELLHPGGKLVLETHVTLQNDMNALFVEDKFREEPTWWWIPSVNVVLGMLRACGFVDAQFRASVHADSRNPNNPDFTVEALPVGGRAFFTAFRPTGMPIRKI